MSVVTGCVLGMLVLYLGPCRAHDKQYSIVIDAGPFSTNLLVATFEKKSGRLQLKDKELYETFKFSLGDFVDNPQGIKEHLETILQKAEKFVSDSHWKETLVNFRATSWFRFLGSPSKRFALLEEVKKVLSTCKFKKESSTASILSESDEGLFGWLAVNLLAERLYGSPDDMIATLDLDDVFSRITFPLVHAYFEQFPLQLRWIEILKEKKFYYSRSFEGLGLEAATLGVLARDNPRYAETYHSPCISPSDNGKTFHYDGDVYKVAGLEGDEREDVNIEQCTRFTKDFVKGYNMRNYSPFLKYTLYAISGFVDVLKEAHAIDGKGEGTITVDEIHETADKVCKKTGHHDDPFLCFHLIYIHTLLTDAYHLPADTKISVTGLLNDHHTNWALGLAYYTLETGDPHQ